MKQNTKTPNSLLFRPQSAIDPAFSSNDFLNPPSFYNTIYTDTSKIIDTSRYVANGRVNILDTATTPTSNFHMQEKIALRNKSTSYCDALSGIWEENVIAQVFFSKENIQIIQNGLRAGVYQRSGEKFVVPPQNIDALKTVMRSVFLQNVEYDANAITEQVEKLNALVLNYCVDFVYKESIAYLKYTQDQSSLVVPLRLPLNHDRQYKQLELKPWV